MKIARINVWSAAISLAASIAWLLLGDVPSALIWMAASVVWLTAALLKMRSPETEPLPLRRILRRIYRLLMWA